VQHGRSLFHKDAVDRWALTPSFGAIPSTQSGLANMHGRRPRVVIHLNARFKFLLYASVVGKTVANGRREPV